MTKQEIIDKINTGIRGQGSMVDIGGVLADVLEGILENAAKPEPKITIRESQDFTGLDAEEAAERLGITVDELNEIPNQSVIATAGSGVRYEFTRVMKMVDSVVGVIAIFGYYSVSSAFDSAEQRKLVISNGLYSYQKFAV